MLAAIDPHDCTDDEVCRYLTACLAEDNGGAGSIARTLASVARIRGMAQLADELEDPEDVLGLGTTMKAMRALGFQLTVEWVTTAPGK